jgi:hypothetical protein
MTIEPNELTEQALLKLADSMAAAASHFSSHGYEEFIEARDQFAVANAKLFQLIAILLRQSTK